MSQDPVNTFSNLCVVEASAGSGKTYALAKRYVELLINPRISSQEIPLKNILAITFSNKAAHEMKARILDFLKKIALDSFSSNKERDEMFLSLGVPHDLARKKALVIMDVLLKNYNFFQVQTIDSFINAILSGCSFKLGLSASFRIRTDCSQYLSLSLDRLIDRASSERGISALFEKFMEQYLYLQNLPAWFPRKDIYDEIRLLFFKSNITGIDFYRSGVEAGDVIVLKKKTFSLMRELAEVLPEGTRLVFKNSFLKFLDGAKDTFDLENIAPAFEREEFPVNKGGVPGKKALNLWKQIRINLKEVAEGESVYAFNPYIDIFKYVSEDLRFLSHKDDVLFLEELNSRARWLFDDNGVTVPELYYRLAVRLTHFLIDEFQDTSLLQWKNLDPMVSEALSNGGSLFYVGDKKQAIYRFRGGEAALFDSVKGSYSGFEVIDRFLTRNYRSRRNLVEFYNECFSAGNLSHFLEAKKELSKSGLEFSHDEKQEVLNVFKNVRQDVPEGRDGGYVSVEPLEGKTAEERNDAARLRLVSLIKEISERFNYSDIALLARQNDEAELLTEWLIAYGIRVESEKTLNIRNNAYIKELISCLMFLNSPIDDLSFASFILGEIFSKATGRSTQEYRDFIFDVSLKKSRQRHIYLYKEFRDRFPEEWGGLVEEFFRSVGFVPLYELVISIFKAFRVLENFSSHQGFFMKFLELIKSKEEEAPDIGSFIEYFARAADDELYVHVADTDSVKVLTVHKAKGLEFPVVILPFLEMNVRVDTNQSSIEGGRIVLRRITEKYRAFSSPLEELYRKEYLKGFIDELNSVYVALTRASDELYLFVPQKSGRGNNLACALIPAMTKEIGQKEARPKKKIDGRSSHIIPYSRYEDWISMLKEEFSQEVSEAIRHRRTRGEVFHYLLSFAGDLSREDLTGRLPGVFLSAKNKFSGFCDWKQMEKDLSFFIGHESMKPFFYCSGALVLNEKEVVDRKGNTRRIDRLIVMDKEIWVIDFKSSREAASAAQVREYMNIVADIYPGRKIKGFVLNFDKSEAEEIDG